MTAVDRLAGVVAGWAVIALVSYLGAGFAVAVIVHGRSGHAARLDRLLRFYPRVARLALRGLAVAALGLMSAPTTSFASEHPHGDGARRPMVASARPPVEPLDWPLRRPLPHRRARTVVVQHGDSLWSLAAGSLGRNASAAQVAVAWPRWWVANRDVVGPDPDVLHPGARLRVPTAVERNAS